MIRKKFISIVEKYSNNSALNLSGQIFSYRQMYELALKKSESTDFLSAPYSLLEGNRSLDDFVKILACWLSEKPYVPLNPKFPRNRVNQIIAELSALDWSSFYDLAYIIFTSGTTGVPKGVPITFQQLSNYIESIDNMSPIQSNDKVMQSCDLSFDVSVMQMLSAWTKGACLCVIPTNQMLMAARYASDLELTIWNSVPSVASMSLNAGLLKPNSLPKIKFAIFAGEALSGNLVRSFQDAAPNATIVNAYGPTEATITVSHFSISPRGLEQVPENIPIGKADPSVKLSIFKPGSTEATSSLGELCISGPQVTSGYLRDEINAEKFFEHQGIKWYRTGDLVIWDDLLGFCYKGRIDRQIKLKGYRVELQDIESGLRVAAETDMVCVVPHPILPDGTIKDLVGLVTRSETIKFDADVIRNRLSEILPSYMIPAKILLLKEMPLSINGKIDFKIIKKWLEDNS